MLKVSLIFQTIAQRSKVKMLLGQKVYDVWFTPAVQESISQSSQPTVSRVIKGQAVGRRLPKGMGAKDLEKATWILRCANTPRTAWHSGATKWRSGGFAPSALRDGRGRTWRK